jgi:hypothetical protein
MTSSSNDDPLASLADALWPRFREKLVQEFPPQTAPSTPAAMNRQQAASYLGMTANGLRKRQHPLLQGRRLPGYARPVYLRRDLDAWLALGEPEGRGA